MSQYIPTSGITDVLQTIGAGVGAGLTAITQKQPLQQIPGGSQPPIVVQGGSNFTQYLPWVAGIGGAIAVVYFLTRKR